MKRVEKVGADIAVLIFEVLVHSRVHKQHAFHNRLCILAVIINWWLSQLKHHVVSIWKRIWFMELQSQVPIQSLLVQGLYLIA